MKLHIEGDINHYYIQTLCMMLFPGVKFAMDEVESESSTTATVRLIPITDADGNEIVKEKELTQKEIDRQRLAAARKRDAEKYGDEYVDVTDKDFK